MKRQAVLRWLGLAGGAAIATSLKSCRSAGSAAVESPTGNRAEAIVIGAGIAGIAAARALGAAGHRVILLEARDRLGGRLWSVRPPELGGVGLDMGASWIHGSTNNPLTKLAQQFKLPTQATDYENLRLYDPTGTPIPPSRQRAIERQFTQLLRQQDNGRGAGQSDRPLAQDLQRLAARLTLSPAQQTELAYAITTTIEHEYSGDAAELSAEQWDEGAEIEGKDLLFPQGYDAIARHLAEGLDLRLSQPVTALEYGRDGVTVTTAQQQFQAQLAIVTLPLGVLKAGMLRFDPPLPQAKQRAIDRLGMGVLNKTWLQFPRLFWPREPDLLGYVSDPAGHWAEWVNFSHYAPEQSLLLGFNAGRVGRELEARSDAQIAAEAMAVLRRIYGPQVPEPVRLWQTRWASDRWTRGSYSFLPVGAKPRDRDRLAEPVDDRLFFAGEATSQPYPATVRGAYESGLRAAEQAAAQLEE